MFHDDDIWAFFRQIEKVCFKDEKRTLRKNIVCAKTFPYFFLVVLCDEKIISGDIWAVTGWKFNTQICESISIEFELSGFNVV